MIDIKLRNVKVEDSITAVRITNQFMANYSERRGVRNGVAYGLGGSDSSCKFYVYRTDKTVICVGDYGAVDK